MKKKILVIIPDRFVKASGGMGENSAPLFEILSDEYDFYVAGFPLLGTEAPSFVSEYHEVAGPFTEVKAGPVNTMIAQASYLAAAVSFPKPDLIYAFDWSVYLAAIYAANFFGGVPMVARMCLSPILLSEQGYTFGLDVKDPIQKALHNAFCEMEIRGLKRADRIVHVSHGYENMYRHVAPFQEKSRLVINGIDLEKWQNKTLKPYSFPGNNKLKIVFLGRLSEMKGIIPLCEARIPKKIDLIFIGNQDQSDLVCMNAINKKVSSEENVFFIGPLYGDEKIQALRSADALMVPSYHEPFGNVGLQGLAAGCVVISSRAGGLGDYLTDETSIFCGMNATTMEQAFAKFLAMTDQEKQKMKDAGFAMCRKLTTNSAAEQLRSVFKELLP